MAINKKSHKIHFCHDKGSTKSIQEATLWPRAICLLPHIEGSLWPQGYRVSWQRVYKRHHREHWSLYGLGTMGLLLLQKLCYGPKAIGFKDRGFIDMPMRVLYGPFLIECLLYLDNTSKLQGSNNVKSLQGKPWPPRDLTAIRFLPKQKASYGLKAIGFLLHIEATLWLQSKKLSRQKLYAKHCGHPMALGQ